MWVVVVVSVADIAVVVVLVVWVALVSVIGIFMRMEDITLNFSAIIESYFLQSQGRIQLFQWVWQFGLIYC